MKILNYFVTRVNGSFVGSSLVHHVGRLAFSVLIALALCSCTTGTIGPACGSNVTGVVPGSSVRLLTFNTQLLSPMFSYGSVELTNDNVDVRAGLIADLLTSGRFDVIALQEVWDEDDGKGVLWGGLCPTYPHYVKYVDTAGAAPVWGPVPVPGAVPVVPYPGEDSGLMLFSKFPFEPLPDNHFKSEDSETSYGDDSDLIAYVMFEDCDDDDCNAAKGAVLARLKHPSSGRIINVVTTHTQADYGGDVYAGVRGKQIRQIRGQCETGLPAVQHPSLIEKTLQPSLGSGQGLCKWPNEQWLLVMGDLNIRGEGAVGDALFPAEAPSQGSTEWWYSIGSPAKNADTTGYSLYDAWAETTSEADRGITGGESTRLDYILASRRTAPSSLAGPTPRDLCVQHIWIPPEFEGLSDHRPVAADLNLEAPQCNLRLADSPAPEDMAELGPSDGKEARKFHREIQHPGGMQWWRLQEPGTYTIALDPNVALDPNAPTEGVTFEVYEADNLSRPLDGTYKLGKDTIKACEVAALGAPCRDVEGEKFVLLEPAYVRVFNVDRSWTGNYWIAFHKYTCKTMEEACERLPNKPEAFPFPPGGTPLNPDDRAWFRIEVREQADSGKRQQLRFYADNAMEAEWQEPSLTLLDSTGTTQLSQIDGQPVSGPISSTTPSGKSMVALDGQTGIDEVFFLRVGRADVNEPLRVRVGWQTDLILLGGSAVGPTPAKLVCHDETNPEYGKDEIDLEVNIDGMGWHTRGHHEFDCNEADDELPWDSQIGVIRFLESVQMRLAELDDGPDDVAQAGTAPTPSWPMNIEIPDDLTPHEMFWEWEGGSYTFQFNVGKWLVGKE